METILDRFEHHMATLPDTDPEVAVAVLHHLWEMIEAHEARLQTISSPALAAPAVAAHSAWLTDFRSGIEYLYTYYECRVAQQMGLAYTSEYSEGYEEHDKMAQVFLSRAERIRAECAAALATARERCR